MSHVAAIQGAYERAVAHGVDVQPLLFEEWGGWSPAVVELMEAAAVERRNKLTRAEYNQATWSTRSWSVFAARAADVVRPGACCCVCGRARARAHHGARPARRLSAPRRALRTGTYLLRVTLGRGLGV
jgi:hypothetical protein